MQVLKIQLKPIQEPAVVHVSLRRFLVVFTVKLGYVVSYFLEKKIFFSSLLGENWNCPLFI